MDIKRVRVRLVLHIDIERRPGSPGTLNLDRIHEACHKVKLGLETQTLHERVVVDSVGITTGRVHG